MGPIVKAMCKELYEKYGTVYYPGEEKLDELYTQLKKIDPSVDRRHGYNADNIVRLSNSGLEIFVSEVSSRYGAEKKDKHATDHYCLCREKKVAIPHEFSDRQGIVLDFICFVNEMKV